MRSLLVLPLFALACVGGPEEVETPKSSNSGAHRAAREAALEVVNDCTARGFEVRVERKGTACRQWIHYEVHCQDDSVASYARLVCDERDDFCARASEVCHQGAP